MQYKDYNDEELIMYIREESEDATEILYEKYKPLVISIVQSYYHSYVNFGIEKKDLIQEGYIGLDKAIHRYSEVKDSTFYTFAKKCIERKVISALIKANRQKNKCLNESLSLNYISSLEDIHSLENFLYDEKEDPLKKIIGIENEEELWSSIQKKFTEYETKVLSLKIEGLKYEEIAKTLGTDSKSIDNAMSRIRRKVKKILEKK